MPKIHGMTVTLHVKELIGADELGVPVYRYDEEVQVENVLVSPVNSGGQDVVDAVRLLGKSASYVLAIPKGDTHEWNEAVVEFFGERWKCFEIPTQGIEANIPLRWNKKVVVERYE